MKKVLCGLVIALMINQNINASNSISDNYIKNIIKDSQKKSYDKYAIHNNKYNSKEIEIYEYKYENICKEIKKDIGEILFYYIVDRETISDLEEEQANEKDPEKLSVLKEALEFNKEYKIDTEDLSEEYIKATLFSAVCKK